MKSYSLKAFIQNFGRRYSEILGIDLSSGKDEEIFKWFLASVLFGAPITEKAVIKTYKCFEERDVLTPERILKTGWDGLVEILDKGSYTRYDFKTADKLLEVMRNLMQKYDGHLSTLHDKASSGQDLEKRIKDLGKGIGDVTVSIFLRELRDVWKEANPNPTRLVILAAKKLGIIRGEATETPLEQLEVFWSKNRVPGKSFIDLETALLRFGKDFCRRGKGDVCLAKGECLNHGVP
jgi:endonuclease III